MAKNIKGAGAKCKLTPALQRKICKLLEEGHFVTTVCKACRITPQTYHKWRKFGKDETSEVKYQRFLEATDLAEANAELNALNAVLNISADKNDIRGYMWYLERRHKNNFGNDCNNDDTDDSDFDDEFL